MLSLRKTLLVSPPEIKGWNGLRIGVNTNVFGLYFKWDKLITLVGLCDILLHLPI